MSDKKGYEPGTAEAARWTQGSEAAVAPQVVPPGADVMERAEMLVTEIARLEIVDGREVGTNVAVVVGPKTKACAVRALHAYGDERAREARAAVIEELRNGAENDLTFPEGAINAADWLESRAPAAAKPESEP